MNRYKKDEFDVYRYDFVTLHQFLTYIKTAPVNTEVFTNCRSQDTNDREWFGTESFEKAVKLCQKGWSQDFDKLVRMKKNIDEKLLDPVIKPRQVVDFYGYSPSVPDYLQGSPFNMWNRINVYVPRFINIYMNIAYSCETRSNAIFNRGIIVLSLVDALQSRGYSVRLKIFECATMHNEAAISFFNLKGDGEKLNIKKAYFPICHPSFLRRLIFRLREVTPVEEEMWTYGYGCVPGVETFKKFIDAGPNDIIIVQPSDMGVSGQDIDEDLEAVLEFTNLKEILVRA